MSALGGKRTLGLPSYDIRGARSLHRARMAKMHVL